MELCWPYNLEEENSLSGCERHITCIYSISLWGTEKCAHLFDFVRSVLVIESSQAVCLVRSNCCMRLLWLLLLLLPAYLIFAPIKSLKCIANVKPNAIHNFKFKSNKIRKMYVIPTTVGYWLQLLAVDLKNFDFATVMWLLQHLLEKNSHEVFDKRLGIFSKEMPNESIRFVVFHILTFEISCRLILYNNNGSVGDFKVFGLILWCVRSYRATTKSMSQYRWLDCKRDLKF